MKRRLINCISLLITFFKIGLFTFGGGYAMIGLIQQEVVEKKKWLTQDEMFQIIVIAESTPGPIAVNIATYTGYKVASYLGSAFATIGLTIPSFVIIFIISLFYKDFLSLSIVNAAFKGIKIGVIVLLINTIIKLAKKMKKNLYFYITFALSLLTMILFTIFIPAFTWISLILIVLGLFIGTVKVRFFKEGEHK